MRSRVGGLHGRRLAVSLVKIALASAVMGLAVAVLLRPIEAGLGLNRLARLVELAAGVPLGAGVFYAACRALGVKELEAAAAALAAPLGRLRRALPLR